MLEEKNTFVKRIYEFWFFYFSPLNLNYLWNFITMECNFIKRLVKMKVIISMIKNFIREKNKIMFVLRKKIEEDYYL